MGDDYDILCKDMLHELNIIFASGETEKAAKKIKKIQAMLNDWNKRKTDFEKYRL